MNSPVATFVPCPNHPQVTLGLGACGQCGRNFCSDCLVRLGGVPTCAGCKQERLSELRSGAVELDLAGPWARFLAQFLDGLVFLIPGTVLFFSGFFLAARTLGQGSDAKAQWAVAFFAVLYVLLATVCVVVYEAMMLTAWGQTLGKMALGIKVVTLQGGDIRAGQAWARAGSRAAMNAFYVGIIDVLFIFSAQHRTLHDRLAGTVVVNWKR
jgi:uncharacterized RDD family membrane protein YckC